MKQNRSSVCTTALLLTIVLIASGTSHGQSCHSSTVLRGSRIIHQPSLVVHTPIVAIATPVIATHVPTYVNTVAVPVAVPVIVPAAVFQYMPAVTPTQPQAPLAAPVAAPVGAAAPANLDAVIRARVDAILAERAGAVGGGRTAASDLPIARESTAFAGGIPAGQPAGAGAEAETDAAEAVGILKTRCASCHTGPTSKGGFVIFNPDGNTLVPLDRSRRSLISTLSDTAQMPPAARGDPKSASALSDAEVQALKQWAAAR